MERGKIRRQRRRFEELLPRYEAAITECNAGTHDITCGAANSYGEVDLTPHQRNTNEVNLAPRTALIEELEVAEGSGEGSGDGEAEEEPAEEEKGTEEEKRAEEEKPAEEEAPPA